MRMYAHDYVWGVQDRRPIPGAGYGILDLYDWMRRCTRWKRRAPIRR